MGKSTISMVIFNSYFDITRGYQPLKILNETWGNQPSACLEDVTRPGAFQKVGLVEAVVQEGSGATRIFWIMIYPAWST